MYYFSGTPKVILSSSFYHIPYLTNLKANASIQLQSHFPPILEVKWQKIRGTTADDIDINLSRLQGSTVDSSNPQLQISRVTFESDNANSYRCLARNSEGWGTSYNRTLSVIGSMLFLSPKKQKNSSIHIVSLQKRIIKWLKGLKTSFIQVSNLNYFANNLN